jgi:hypothetical protein
VPVGLEQAFDGQRAARGEQAVRVFESPLDRREGVLALKPG